MKLPPGHRARTDFPRFGLSQYADRIPNQSSDPTFSIETIEPIEAACEEAATSVHRVAALEALERVERIGALHCVTTWSAVGLRWSGWSLFQVLEALVPEDLRKHRNSDDVVIVVSGLDGFKGRLTMEDALDPSVMLADRLDGEPLGIEHGAPLRLVAPRHYGYKNVKHIKAIKFRRRGDGGLGYGRLGFLEHLRGRVDFEERGGLPGRLLRYLYRPFIGSTVRQFRKAQEAHEEQNATDEIETQ